MDFTTIKHQQLLKLTLLLQLQQRAEQAPSDELRYVVVNETADLLPYRQAVLWHIPHQQLVAVSGVAKPEPNAPYNVWLKRFFRFFHSQARANQLMAFNAADLPSDLADEWQEWLPEWGLWIPLSHRLGTQYVLILFRDAVWQDGDIHLLSYLANSYGQALALSEMTPARSFTFSHLRKKILQISAVIAVSLLMLMPVRQSVLAEAEVIAQKPHLVRAPLDGVVETFFVQPNDNVREGQKLFALDTTQLRSRLAVAQETLDMAKTDYLQTTQQAILDASAKAKLASLKSKWEQQIAEVDYVRSLLARCEVTTNKAGIAVFDDPSDWLGHPVKQGEKILAVANPDAVELEIYLPMDDLLELHDGSEVLFFPNVSPHHPLEAHLNYFSYKANSTPANIMAYRLTAEFTQKTDNPRLGYRGIAKLYGSKQMFIVWLLRKPIRTARMWLGL